MKYFFHNNIYPCLPNLIRLVELIKRVNFKPLLETQAGFTPKSEIQYNEISAGGAVGVSTSKDS